MHAASRFFLIQNDDIFMRPDLIHGLILMHSNNTR